MGAFAALKYSDKKLLKQVKDIAAERDIKAIFDDEDGAHFKKMLSWWVLNGFIDVCIDFWQVKTMDLGQVRYESTSVVIFLALLISTKTQR